MFVPVAPDVRGRGSWFEGAHSCRGGEVQFLEWIAFRGGRAVFCLPLISAEALLLPACPHFSHGLACKEHRPISQPPPVPRRKESSFRAYASEPFPCKQLVWPAPNDRAPGLRPGLQHPARTSSPGTALGVFRLMPPRPSPPLRAAGIVPESDWSFHRIPGTVAKWGGAFSGTSLTAANLSLFFFCLLMNERSSGCGWLISQAGPLVCVHTRCATTLQSCVMTT